MKASISNDTVTLTELPVARLSRDDWLDAAFEIVAEQGFDSVRVLTLAKSLDVTRGSFYWHFSDHAELIAGLIERWRTREIKTTSAQWTHPNWSQALIWSAC